VAAELLERAAALTPAADRADGLRRRLAAADTEFATGNTERARALLDAALGEARPGAERAEVLLRLGEMVVGDDIERSAELLREAEREAGEDPALRATILCALAKFRYGLFIGYDECENCARSAAKLAERVGDRRTLALALALIEHRVFMRGGGIDEGRIERAIRIEESEPDEAIDAGEDGSAAMICAEVLVDGERYEQGRALLERLCDRGRRVDDSGVAYPLHILALLEFHAGHWERAELVAREAVELAVQSGRETIEVLAASVLGTVEGALGRISPARRALEDALALAAKVGRGGRMPRYGLGLLELSLEDYCAAWMWLEPAIERMLPLGLSAPGEQVSDGVEALAQLGRVDEATRLLAAFDAPARRWSLAAGTRNRGLLLAAEDDLGGAEIALHEAVAIGETVPRPLERGRSLLALGTVQRRLRRKQAARATLGEAAELFEELGAPVWAQRARRESGRIGGRVPYEHELSATEEQIAELVRLGRSNKQVAGELHLSVKTVEWNLSKVYRKLGIHSRTQL
jgi:DNA-binding CsgD family transcriptional regulator